MPKKKSRSITVDCTSYRWLVSVRQGFLNLTVEAEEVDGPILQAFFEPHDSYQRNDSGDWTFKKQNTAISPKTVKRVIQLGRTNGWDPNSGTSASSHLYTWDTEYLHDAPLELSADELLLKDLATEQVSNLRFDLSIDPDWREKLFNAVPYERHEIPISYHGLSEEVRDAGLHFAAFHDGDTSDGFVVFGIESIEFPQILMYTTNNPSIV